jgi:hypothetical protein
LRGQKWAFNLVLQNAIPSLSNGRKTMAKMMVKYFTPKNWFGPFPDKILHVEGDEQECIQQVMDVLKTFPVATTMEFEEVKE